MLDANKICLVLDLDDTLYQEFDYQTSGLKFVEQQIEELYGKNFKGILTSLRDSGCNDVFLEACKVLRLPTSVKQSFIHLYRTHFPDIYLTDATKKFLKKAQVEFAAIVILTDGRSVSQRQKLKALELDSLPSYISEEWESPKPESKRFKAIQNDFKECELFCYIGDNPNKDFSTPNKLGWATFGVKGTKKNIHSQNTSDLEQSYAPDVWLEQLIEFYNHVKY